MSTQNQYPVKIVEHSVSTLGNDIVTFELTLPKQYVAEFNTHKMEIERNSASSRAIPTVTIIDRVLADPAMPIDWSYNSKGMVPTTLMSKEDSDKANYIWLRARDAMLPYVEELRQLNADKQRSNRLLEPWMKTVVICTMTGSGGIGIPNFFGLRDHIGAQPEFKYVAHQMHEMYHESKPTVRLWHLPYVTEEERNSLLLAQSEWALVSSARCGRVSYYKQGMQYTIDDELNRALSFFTNKHFSPLRHASIAGGDRFYGNMYGWNPISKVQEPETKDYMPQCCERFIQKKVIR